MQADTRTGSSRLRVTSSLSASVRNGRSALVHDVSRDERYVMCDPRVRAELCVPLLDKDSEVLGVLNVESYHHCIAHAIHLLLMVDSQ